MNLQQVRLRLSGGFRPFSLLTSDGREYAVRHPEFVLITAHSLAVADESGYIVTLDPLHIVAIKDLRARKNGNPKR